MSYLCYTSIMKTAIYIPDDIFSTAERIAQRLKISRSELYARAVKEYIGELEAESTIEKLNTLYAQEDSKLDYVLLQGQKRALQDEEW
jgi:metal-responsive CopG/Arc/MetJ family transcriptional regulator